MFIQILQMEAIMIHNRWGIKVIKYRNFPNVQEVKNIQGEIIGYCDWEEN